jgi:oxygen-dependent protoporphyrinogen oxidase
MPPDSVLIVGGGLSGLATAYYLGRAGIRSTIIEKAGRLGGLIKTDRALGCELEAGPDSFLATKTAVAELAVELGGGLPQKIIGSNDSARRIFILRGGKLVPMPAGMSMMVPSEWGPVLRSPLFGFATKLRLLRETFTKPRQRTGDFSVGDLVASHFGSEMLEYITEPLLSGVYGGDSASLSARSVLPRFVGFEEQYGSLIKGVRSAKGADARRQSELEVRKPSGGALDPATVLREFSEANRTPAGSGSLFQSFEGGMQTLTDALSKAVQEYAGVIHGEVTKVEKVETGWRVRLGSEFISTRHLVLATPAWAGAKLLDQSAPSLAMELAAIPYSSAVLAMLVFDKAAVTDTLKGFGFLVPPSERQTIAAATWVKTKFPSRIPDGLVALRAFIVGAQAEQLSSQPKEQVLTAVRKDFGRIMGVHADPVFHTLYSWPKSMPQYVVGHGQRVNRTRLALAALPGLSLTGNYFDGVGIPDCIRLAKQAAKHIAESGV